MTLFHHLVLQAKNLIFPVRHQHPRVSCKLTQAPTSPSFLSGSRNYKNWVTIRVKMPCHMA